MAKKETFIEIYYSYVKTELLVASCQMKIFDAVEKRARENEGWADVEHLSESLLCQPAQLRRFLNALVTIGLLLEKDKKYCNTETSRLYLTSGNEECLLDATQYFHEDLRITTEGLRSTLKEGPQDPSGDIMTNSAIIDRFQTMMKIVSPSSRIIGDLLDKVDTRRIETIVDLGGGYGIRSVLIQRKFPQKSVIVVDLPHVVERGQKQAEKKGGDFSKLRFKGGDFFKGDLPQADCYLLSFILHDWNDEQCRTILRHVYIALPPGGLLLLMEKVLEPDGTGPWPAMAVDVQLMSLGLPGGERTETLYQDLLNSAGFGNPVIHRSEGFVLNDLLEAKKPYA